MPNGARLTPPQWSRDAKRLALLRHDAGSHDAAHLRRRDQVGPRRSPRRADSGAPRARRAAGRGTASTSCSAPRRARAKRSGSPTWTRASAKRLTPPSINYVAGGCSWTAGRAPALCLLFPEGRGAEPKSARSAGRTDRAGVVRPRGAGAHQHLPVERPARRGAVRLLHDVAARGRRARRKDHAARQARRPRAAIGVAGRQVPPRPHDASSVLVSGGHGELPGENRSVDAGRHAS